MDFFVESNLGEQCDTNEDCKLGSGTQCLNNVCACVNGQIPEPVKNPKHDPPQRCIGGTEKLSEKLFFRVKLTFDLFFQNRPVLDLLVEKEHDLLPIAVSTVGFAKKLRIARAGGSPPMWHFLCAVQNQVHWFTTIAMEGNILMGFFAADSDYQAVCNQYNLKLSKIGDEPRRCDILPFTQNFFLNDAIKRNDESTICAVGSSCLLDPFDGSRGICCEPPVVVTSPNNFTTAATDSHETTVFTNTFKPKQTTTTKPTVTEESLAVENVAKTAVEHHSKNYHHNGPVRIITAETFKRVQSKHEE